MEAFGIKNRGLTTANRKYIMQWYQDYGFNIEIIRMAYERAVDQIGQASFPYIGKILQNWHKMGFRRRRTSSAATSRKILAAEANPLPGQAARLMM